MYQTINDFHTEQHLGLDHMSGGQIRKLRGNLVEEIASMIRMKKLTFLYELCDFDDYEHAFKKYNSDFKLRKVVFNMEYPDRMKEHDAKDEAAYKIFS